MNRAAHTLGGASSEPAQEDGTDQVELGGNSDALSGMEGLQFELQLRTILEEAWGEIDHKYSTCGVFFIDWLSLFEIQHLQNMDQEIKDITGKLPLYSG